MIRYVLLPKNKQCTTAQKQAMYFCPKTSNVLLPKNKQCTFAQKQSMYFCPQKANYVNLPKCKQCILGKSYVPWQTMYFCNKIDGFPLLFQSYKKINKSQKNADSV
jgi:hypothetical protein